MAPIFTKDFVDVRVAQEMEGFEELIGSLGGGRAGFPWMVILRSDESVVVDSNHPEKGNIGFPVAEWEIEYFKVMMRASVKRITDDEIEYLAKEMMGG